MSEDVDVAAIVAGRPAGTDPKVTAVVRCGDTIFVFGRDWHAVLRRQQ